MDEHKDAPASKLDTPTRFAFPEGLSISHKIDQLPKDLKNELDRRLADGSFRSSRVLSTWLDKNGYRISHQALTQYGKKFDRRLDAIRLATEQARLVCAQFKDDDVDMQTALLRLVQTRLFEILTAVNEETEIPRRKKKKGVEQNVEKVAPINITVLARSVSGLLRAETENRKWAEKARAAVAMATKKLDEARDKGLSKNAAAQIRAVLMEI
jgi:hydrogenase maturation factor HypF (carbamoyltransferase family)